MLVHYYTVRPSTVYPVQQQNRQKVFTGAQFFCPLDGISSSLAQLKASLQFIQHASQCFHSGLEL